MGNAVLCGEVCPCGPPIRDSTALLYTTKHHKVLGTFFACNDISIIPDDMFKLFIGWKSCKRKKKKKVLHLVISFSMFSTSSL